MTTPSRLSADAMIAITQQWLQPPYRDTFQREPLLAPFLPLLHDARERILQADAAPEAAPPQLDALLRALSEEATRLDLRHDALYRGAFHLLNAWALLASDPQRAQDLLDLRARIFPDGLAVTQRSYTEEAGHAERLHARLQTPDRDLLASIPSPDGDLASDLDACIQAARRLGQIEHERQQLRAATPEAAAAPNLRRGWAQLVNAILNTLPLTHLDDAQQQALLLPLQSALDKLK